MTRERPQRKRATKRSHPREDDETLPVELDANDPAIDLRDPSLYFNRELSQLEFFFRVLAQARDVATPLLERLRFLAISTAILDEFFEVRVAGVREQIESGLTSRGPDGRTPQETLTQIGVRAHELVEQQYEVFREELLPSLKAVGVNITFREDWSEEMRSWVREYGEREVLPVLTPVGLDPAHPFPTLVNKSLNFIIELDGKDAFGRTSRMAVVQAPRILPRLNRVPKEITGEDFCFVTLSGVIHENVELLFPGMKVKGCYPFRLTRNSELWVDEEEVDDLLRALKGGLRTRHFGDAVRLEVNWGCPDEVCDFLLKQFGLAENDLYRVHGPVNLSRLSSLYELVDREDLKYPQHVPSLPLTLAESEDMFAAIRKGDILLHHPYQSFLPVLNLLEQAARDPDVLAVKITLYRTGADSPLTDALLEASRNGKEVTAVVELRARFDEEANIDIATKLQEAGAKVVYGVVGYKAHAKMLLIVRREAGKLVRYVHLGTGNYHPKTSRLYTDFGLLSCDRKLGEDVHSLFQQLTGLGAVGKLNTLLQSPFTLRDGMVSLIERETRIAQAGRPARIRAKMNSLTESGIIRELYRASQAGVKIELVVRGICCLRPGVPGVSENISVRSIVGRFLEHSRVFHFHADGAEVTYCSSADWMPRNLKHRVETAFPIEAPVMKARVLHEAIELSLADNTQAWTLKENGQYVRVERAEGAEPFRVQQALIELHS